MSKQTTKKIIGICRLCKEEKELNFEHFPPKSAYNNTTRYFSVSHDDFFKTTKTESLLNFRPRGKQFQGGLGEYCLCHNCNSFLGSAYVREYKKWATLGMQLLNEGKFKSIQFTSNDIDYLKILKQIIAIFICNNQPFFTESYPGLLEFVKDVSSKELPNRYRIYIYLNNEGQLRNGQIYFTNLYGTVCEFTFRPFGYVLSIDRNESFPELLEITGLKDLQDYKKAEIQMILNKYPTYLPFPMDFRTKEEIKNCR